MKIICFVFVVFSVGLDQVYSDRANSSARRSQVRNREYYASVPVVIVYDDSANRKKEVASSTEGKLAVIPSTTEAILETTLGISEQTKKIETTSDNILLPDVPIVPKQKTQRSNRRTGYEIPVAVVYDSATETHIREKLEAVTDSDIPVTVRNIRQRGRKRYRDQQDNGAIQIDKEVKLKTRGRVLKEATVNPIESNSLPKETAKTKTVVRRRRPSKEGLKVVATTQPSVAQERIVSEKVIKEPENVASRFKEPVIYENVKSNPTEPAIEMTTSLIDESLQDEQVLVSKPKNTPIIKENKPFILRRRPSKENLKIVKSTEPTTPNEPNVTENISNISENVKSNPVIDESLQDEEIFVSSLKNEEPIISDEKPVKVQKGTKTRGPVTPKVNSHNFLYPTKPVAEVTTPSIDESSASSQDEQITPSPRNKAIISKIKPNKDDRRTRIRGPVVPIVNSQNFQYQNGEFRYSFEGGDGTKKFENGVQKTFNDDVTGEAVEGGYSYKDKDGKSFSLTYTADENGYRPVGAHLPTPPPIPPAIARALRYLATKPTPVDYDDVTETMQHQDA